jgi:hypothetical protein
MQQLKDKKYNNNNNNNCEKFSKYVEATSKFLAPER